MRLCNKDMNYRLIWLISTILLVGCTSRSLEKNEPHRYDTLESFNRAMFNFNYNILDPYLLRPVAVVWRCAVPQHARNGLNNFFSNLEEPASMINSLLIGDAYKAMTHFNRFFLNTLLGVGGFVDVAGMTNPKLARELPYRFGSTLGHYNVGYGPYLVLPGYGSATFRQDGGKWLDTLYPVLNYLTFWMSTGKWIIEGIETRAQLLNSDDLLRNSSDPYLMVRSAYFQRYDFLANDGVLKPEADSNGQIIQDDLQHIDSND